MKIDRRKKYYLILDTETCPIDASEETVNPHNMLVYDIGFAIIDKKGNIYESYSYVIKDIFVNQPTKMRSAYYYNKLPIYLNDLAQGTRKLVSIDKAKKKINKLLEKYNTNIVIAHNCYFDYTSLQTTTKFLNKGYFFKYDIEFWDTMKMVYSTIYKQVTYKRFCEKNNYITKNNRCRVTAEVLARFIFDDLTFEEKHTGIDDIMIEKEIFALCMRQHKKMNKKLFKDR